MGLLSSASLRFADEDLYIPKGHLCRLEFDRKLLVKGQTSFRPST